MRTEHILDVLLIPVELPGRRGMGAKVIANSPRAQAAAKELDIYDFLGKPLSTLAAQSLEITLNDFLEEKRRPAVVS